MVVDPTELPPEYHPHEPAREAMTSGDLLLIAVVLFLGWCAVYGPATIAAWLLGVM